jgi:hypothetical protein
MLLSAHPQDDLWLTRLYVDAAASNSVLVHATLWRGSFFRHVVPAHFLIKVGSETKAS